MIEVICESQLRSTNIYFQGFAVLCRPAPAVTPFPRTQHIFAILGKKIIGNVCNRIFTRGTRAPTLQARQDRAPSQSPRSPPTSARWCFHPTINNNDTSNLHENPPSVHHHHKKSSWFSMTLSSASSGLRNNVRLRNRHKRDLHRLSHG